MPAIYTHYKFGKDVLNKLDKKVKKSILEHDKYYYIFNQSFDNLYYYKLYFPFIGSDIRKLGSMGHKKNINLYFKNIITYILDNNLKNNNLIKSFLYGSINHYILDSTLHPFVFYKAGVYKPKIKSTHKYNYNHAKLEFMLDAYLYNLDTRKKYNNYKIHKEIVPIIKFSQELKDLINYIYKETFKINNISDKMLKSIKDEHYIFKFIIEDKYGIKRFLFKLIDFITTNKVKNIHNNNTYIKNIDKELLNLNNKRWYHPVNNKKYNTSSIDLYNKSLDRASDLINKLELLFNNKYDLETILKEIEDNSYITGLSIKEKNKLKYFEH